MRTENNPATTMSL